MRTLIALVCLFVLDSLFILFIKQQPTLFWDIFFAITIAINILIDITSIVLSFGNPFWGENHNARADARIGFSSSSEVSSEPTKKDRRWYAKLAIPIRR